MRRFWIRYTSQQRVRVIDCLQARTPPDALRLEVPAPRHPPRIKTTVRVTYVPVLFHLPLHLPFPIHSSFPVIKPRTNSRLFYIPCLLLKCTPLRPPTSSPSKQPLVNSLFSQYTSQFIPPHLVTDLGLDASLIFNWFVIPSLPTSHHPLTSPCSVYSLTFLLTNHCARNTNPKLS